MKTSHFILNLFFILLFAVPVTGSEFYVSTAGKDSNPGTQSAPWRTIQKAMNSATPGSTVQIMAGTYSERLSINVSGTPGNYITFQPFGYTGRASDGSSGGASIAANGYKQCVGDQVILDYASLGIVNDSIPLLNINNQRYVRVQGLTLQNFRNNGTYQYGVWIYGGSNNVDFINNRMLNLKSIAPVNDFSAWYENFEIDSANNVNIIGNEMGKVVTSVSNCITLYGASVKNCLVESNYIHDTDGIAIDIYQGTSNHIIRANLLEHISLKSDGTNYYSLANAIYVDGGQFITIERNLVRNSGCAIAALAEPATGTNAHDVIIRDNICYGNGGAGVMLGNWYSDRDGSILYNTEVLNNTLYKNKYGFLIRPFTSSSVVWKNNLLSNNTISVINALSWPVGTMDYNLYFGGGNGADVHQVTANPQCTNPAANPPDFSLLTSSPAINAGDPSFVAETGERDFLGKARVVGGRVDIGALEFQ